MLVDRGSLLRKVSDRQLTSENINFNSISNMIYGISSMIYGIGASIDVSVRSVLRESRPGFPARGHDSESKRAGPTVPSLKRENDEIDDDDGELALLAIWSPA